MGNVFKLPSVFEAIDRYSAPLRKMEAATGRFVQKAEVGVARVERRVRAFASAVRSTLGNVGITLGAVALFATLSGGIRIIKDYEQANANLAAVLNVERVTIRDLADDSKRLGASTAFTASQVAGLQIEYAKLGFVQDEILKATEATLSLAAATKTELPQAAKQVGAAIRAFNLEASAAKRVSDVFAAATSKSALNMEFLDTAISTVAPVAAKFGFTIEETVGLLGKLADAGFDASSAATATRNILLNLADSNGKLARALGRPVKNIGDLVSGLNSLTARGINLNQALELTDKRSVAAFATFLSSSDAALKLSKNLGRAGDTAELMALKQLDTLSGSIIKAQSAYQGFILSLEDGSGAFAKNIRFIVDVITEVLSMAAGIDTAKTANDSLNESVRDTAKVTLSAATQLSIIKDRAKQYAKQVRVVADRTVVALKFTGALVSVYLFLKAVVITARVAMVAYNIGLAAHVLITGRATMALRGYTLALFLVTQAQTVLNAVMAANPIGLIVIAVAALIALVAVVVNKWEDWGAALSLFMGPLGTIISLVMSFRKNWDLLTKIFKTEGFIAGFKSIGKVIYDALLVPLEQLFQLLSNVPGLDFASNVADIIGGVRGTLALSDPEEREQPEIVNTQASIERSRTSREETITRQDLNINLRGNTDLIDSIDQIGPNPIPVIVGPSGEF